MIEPDKFDDEFRLLDVANYDFSTCPTRVDAIGPIYREDAYAALVHSNGHIADAALLLGRQRGQFARWLKAHPEFSVLQDDLVETDLDTVERSVFDAAKSGDGANARFLLTTKGKNRGYSTRTELTGRDGEAIKFDAIIQDRLSPEQVARAASEYLESVGDGGEKAN